MTLQAIGLFLLCMYLGWTIYAGMVEDKKKPQKTGKIRFVSQKTGEVFDMDVEMKNVQVVEGMDDESFTVMAKVLFRKTAEAFAACDMTELKSLLSSQVYSVFKKEIDKRLVKNERLDFSLIGIMSAKIVKKSAGYKKVSVEFVSEQVNVLTDKAANVIEGDPMYVAEVKDVWTFEKKGKSSWIVSATKSGVQNAA